MDLYGFIWYICILYGYIRFNEFVFPDPEPPTINVLYGWSGISGQLGLCSFVSYFVI